jgi:hypothetical protein
VVDVGDNGDISDIVTHLVHSMAFAVNGRPPGGRVKNRGALHRAAE